MTWHWKVFFTILFLFGDIVRIIAIDKPRPMLTRTDAAIGVGISAVIIVALWWPS